MIPSLRYVNHKGDVYDFEKGKIWPLAESLYDFSVSYQLSNGQVAGHTFEPREIPISVAMSPDDPASEMNLFYDVLMTDVLANVPGRLYDGVWYIECLLKKHDKRYWYRDTKTRTFDLALWAPNPVWTKDVVYTFYTQNRSSKWLNYPHPYPHSYGGSSPVESICLDAITECDFKIEIFGYASDPSVQIGSNRYYVNVTVPSDGSLVIDSRKGVVEIVLSNGVSIDVYKQTLDVPPGSGEYIFEPIKPGSQNVSWNGDYSISLTLYEQSQERRWLS